MRNISDIDIEEMKKSEAAVTYILESLFSLVFAFDGTTEAMISESVKKGCPHIWTDANYRIVSNRLLARGDLFLQIEADMFDREVKVTKGNEQSCMGAAMAAAVGIGMYASYQEACEHMISYQDKIVKPIQENVKIYQESYQMYREIYANNKAWFHRKEN